MPASVARTVVEARERALEDVAHLLVVELLGLGIERQREAEERQHHRHLARRLQPVAVHVLRHALDGAEELRGSQREAGLIVCRLAARRAARSSSSSLSSPARSRSPISCGIGVSARRRSRKQGKRGGGKHRIMATSMDSVAIMLET